MGFVQVQVTLLLIHTHTHTHTNTQIHTHPPTNKQADARGFAQTDAEPVFPGSV